MCLGAFPDPAAIARARGRRLLLDNQQRLQLDQNIWLHSFKPPGTQGLIALQTGLSKGADPNPGFAVPYEDFESGHGLVWRTAYSYNIPCLQLALKYGAYPDVSSYEKKKSRYITPLFLSAEALDYQAVQLLFLRNANSVSQGRSHLETVCSSTADGKVAEQIKIVKIIVVKHANFGQPLDAAVNLAIRYSNISIVKYLLGKGATPTSFLEIMYDRSWSERLLARPIRYANMLTGEWGNKPSSKMVSADVPLKYIPPKSWIRLAVSYYTQFPGSQAYMAVGLNLALKHQDLMAMKTFLEAGATVVDLDLLIFQTLNLLYGTRKGTDDTLSVLKILARRGAMFDLDRKQEWDFFATNYRNHYRSPGGIRETFSEDKDVRYRCSTYTAIQRAERAYNEFRSNSRGDRREFQKEATKVRAQIMSMASKRESSGCCIL